MLRKFFAFTLALLLVGTIPLGALAEEYDLVNGSITVEAKEDGQYVSQVGVADNVKQTTETVIKQTDSDTKSTENTITIKAEKDQTAEVTISDVNIDVSNDGKAAISAEGDGNVIIELDGSNTVKSGEDHAGVEKNNSGNLTIADADTDGVGSLEAAGGNYGAGIGGGYEQDVSDITIEGGDITATGGKGGAGIGGGSGGSGSDITIRGDAQVAANGGDANGGKAGAGIGGGQSGSGSKITIEGNAQVEANGGNGGAGIGGGWHSLGGEEITIGGNAQVEANGGTNGAGIGGGNMGYGTGITIKDDAQVNATSDGLGAGIGGGSNGNGSNITIEGNARVDATGGVVGAGIGGGYFGSASDITIRGNAQVGVQGGNGRNKGGSGAGIGKGGSWNPNDERPQAGCEETPNTNDLTTGSIAYYAPGADKSKDTPEKLLHKTADGTMEAHTGVTLKSSTEATCLKNATVTYQCSCGETVTIEQPGTALGHEVDSYTYDNNATCMADGTESGVCKRCDKTVSRTKAGTLDPNKHDFTDYISNNDATCTADGTETAQCAYGCGATDTQPDVGSKLAHKFDNNYVSNNDATCTENGTETAKCAYGCGTEDTREIPDSKLPHDFENYVYQDNATCESDGTEIAQCEHCDATDERTADGTALGHSFTHYVSNNDATYDSDGTQTAECDHGCGATNTIPAPGTRIPLYRVVDAAGMNLPSRESKDGTVLTITAEQDHATLTGTLDGIRTLQQRGITTIVFVTNNATSTFDLANLTGAGSYALTHDGEAVSFTLNGQDASSILK